MLQFVILKISSEAIKQFKPELQGGSKFSSCSAVSSCAAEQEDLAAYRI